MQDDDFDEATNDSNNDSAMEGFGRDSPRPGSPIPRKGRTLKFYWTIHANPSKFYILSLGFSGIEMKQGFIIGVYLLYSYGVSFTGVQEGLIERAEGSSSGHCRC